jgi:SNF2 family DNA or RNA helicase
MIGLEEVCYGRIADATVASHKVPKPSGRMVIPEDTWPMMKVELRREQGKSAMIRVVDPSGAIFGTLDSKTANALTPLIDSPTINLRTQVRLMMRQKRRDEWPGQPCSASLQLSINLYGPRKHGPAIGKFLGQHNIWLSTPPMVDAGIQVVNPHVNNQKANKAPSSMRGPQNYEYNYETQTLDEQHAAIGQMFDSMKVEDIPEMEPPSAVITPMLRHQKQALHFMTQKEKPVTFGKKEDETSTLWRIKFRPNGQKYYYNIITGNETPDEPAQVFGGILADMMGLGKTLSILSLVVSSLPQAEAWTSRTPETVGPYAGLRRCKTTLLVSPLSAVVNWEEQIKTHIQDGALSSYVYHGSSRISDVDELAQYDVVITTYSIVLSDLEGRRNKTAKARKSPLAQLNFFRIVLDEAHIIREQSTGQSQVVCLLPADRRWAVTGTPVQNRLDDFAALTKFLRLAPLDNKVVFARAILTPFKMLNADVVPKLQLLVSSITLRRLKDRIELPKRHDQVVKLTFSEDEQALHDFFRKESELKVKVLTGKDKVGAGMYHHILLALLKLRLISAHGKELLKEDDLKRLRGSTAKDAIDLDDEDSYKVDTKNAYEIFELRLKHSLHECAECTEVLGQEAKEETLGYVLPCHCLVCRECYVSSRSPARKMIDANEHITCPYCQANVQATSYIITRRGLENYRESHDEVSRDTSQTKAITHYGGPHTKTKALISHLRQSIQQSSLLPEGESPIKSVVFSGWTSHLNLIQIALEDNQIPFARLDGSMTRTARSAALTAFSSDPSILVLLVTIGAGGVGLNLTSASNVYVMEPQFNPAAESQAIDRIHRLGQKREVMTTRFIMEGSIEEKIQEIQRKKQSLADLSMDRGKALSKKETALEKLKELRSLFK